MPNQNIMVWISSLRNHEEQLERPKPYKPGLIVSIVSVMCSATIREPAAEVAQLGERKTEDLKVPDSNPENSYEFW